MSFLLKFLTPARYSWLSVCRKPLSLVRPVSVNCGLLGICLILGSCVNNDRFDIPAPFLIAQEDWGPLYRNLPLISHPLANIPVIINIGGLPSSTLSRGCSVEPALPAGLVLAFANSSCAISGTPTETADYQAYIITVSNVSGSDSHTIRFAVEESPPIFFTYDLETEFSYSNSVNYTGEFAQLSIPNLTGEPLDSCVLADESPRLPAGLSLIVSTVINDDEEVVNGSSCLIRGATDLDAATEFQTYAINATNAVGATTVQIAVSFDILAPFLTPPATALVATLNEVYNLIFINQGSRIVNCDVEPALPVGLEVNVDSTSGSCRITGTPTAVSEETLYVLSASNPATGDLTVDAIFILSVIN